MTNLARSSLAFVLAALAGALTTVRHDESRGSAARWRPEWHKTTRGSQPSLRLSKKLHLAAIDAVPLIRVRAGPVEIWTCPLRQLQERATFRIYRRTNVPPFGFGSCDCRHKLPFECPIIFWTAREVPLVELRWRTQWPKNST
jgi:hypothetical protein